MRNQRKPEVAQYFFSAEKNKCQPGILHLAKLVFKIEGEINISSDKGKLEELFANGFSF